MRHTITSWLRTPVSVFLVALLLVVLPIVLLADDEEVWQAFKQKYHKSYSSPAEEARRRRIFLDNKDFVDSQNTKQTANFIQEANSLSDLTVDEINRSLNGFRLTRIPYRTTASELEQLLQAYQPSNGTFSLDFGEPAELDYRKLGRVSKVKNQGPCGSCWAFATTGSLESVLAARRRPILLSEQNLVDCSRAYGNHACNGGLMDSALRYVRDYGIMTAIDYPYKAKEGRCRFRRSRSVVRTRTPAILPSGNETLLRNVLARTGPLPVAIDASLRSFHLYKSGIYDDENCKSSERSLNHAVLLVGYGTDRSAGDYWLVKNSWSEDWGSAGYIKLARNKNNRCGISSYAVLPIPYR